MIFNILCYLLIFRWSILLGFSYGILIWTLAQCQPSRFTSIWDQRWITELQDHFRLAFSTDIVKLIDQILLWQLQLCDLYENDSIFDKFECCLSGDGLRVATGSYRYCQFLIQLTSYYLFFIFIWLKKKKNKKISAIYSVCLEVPRQLLWKQAKIPWGMSRINY